MSGFSDYFDQAKTKRQRQAEVGEALNKQQLDGPLQNPMEALKDPEFLQILRDFYWTRDGKRFANSEELIDHFYEERSYRELNSMGIYEEGAEIEGDFASQVVGRVAPELLPAPPGMDEDQKKRYQVIQNVYQQLPSFWNVGEGGRGLSAVGDIAKAIVTDPLNLIGFGAGKAAWQLASQGAKAAGTRALGKTAAQEAALNAAIGGLQDVGIQQNLMAAGAQEGFNTDQLLFSLGIGGAAGGAGGAAFGAIPAYKGAARGRAVAEGLASGTPEGLARAAEGVIDATSRYGRDAVAKPEAAVREAYGTMTAEREQAAARAAQEQAEAEAAAREQAQADQNDAQINRLQAAYARQRDELEAERARADELRQPFEDAGEIDRLNNRIAEIENLRYLQDDLASIQESIDNAKSPSERRKLISQREVLRSLDTYYRRTPIENAEDAARVFELVNQTRAKIDEIGRAQTEQRAAQARGTGQPQTAGQDVPAAVRGAEDLDREAAYVEATGPDSPTAGGPEIAAREAEEARIAREYAASLAPVPEQPDLFGPRRVAEGGGPEGGPEGGGAAAVPEVGQAADEAVAGQDATAQVGAAVDEATPTTTLKDVAGYLGVSTKTASKLMREQLGIPNLRTRENKAKAQAWLSERMKQDKVDADRLLEIDRLAEEFGITNPEDLAFLADTYGATAKRVDPELDEDDLIPQRGAGRRLTDFERFALKRLDDVIRDTLPPGALSAPRKATLERRVLAVAEKMEALDNPIMAGVPRMERFRRLIDEIGRAVQNEERGLVARERGRGVKGDTSLGRFSDGATPTTAGTTTRNEPRAFKNNVAEGQSTTPQTKRQSVLAKGRARQASPDWIDRQVADLNERLGKAREPKRKEIIQRRIDELEAQRELYEGEYSILGKVPYINTKKGTNAAEEALAHADLSDAAARARDKNAMPGVYRFDADKRTKAVDGHLRKGDQGFVYNGKVYSRAHNVPVFRSNPSIPQPAVRPKDPFRDRVLRIKRSLYTDQVDFTQYGMRPGALKVDSDVMQVIEFEWISYLSGKDGKIREFQATGNRAKDGGAKPHDGAYLKRGEFAFYDPETGRIYRDLDKLKRANIRERKAKDAIPEEVLPTEAPPEAPRLVGDIQARIAAAFRAGDMETFAKLLQEAGFRRAEPAAPEPTPGKKVDGKAASAEQVDLAVELPAVAELGPDGKPTYVRVLSEKQEQAFTTLEAAYENLVGKNPKEIAFVRGFVPRGARKDTLKSLDGFRQEGEPPKTRAPEEAAPSAAPSEPAGPVRLTDIADDTVVYRGETITYGSLFIKARNLELTPFSELPDRGAVDGVIKELEDIYSILPEDMLLPSATRAENLLQLDRIFGEDPTSFALVYDSLRRATLGRGDARPDIYSARDPNAPPIIKAASERMRANLSSGGTVTGYSRGRDGSKPAIHNSIIIDPLSEGAMMPDAYTFAHELGHWFYFNMLTPKERVDFWKIILNDYYDAPEAGGGLRANAPRGKGPLSRLEKRANKLGESVPLHGTPQEIFAQVYGTTLLAGPSMGAVKQKAFDGFVKNMQARMKGAAVKAMRWLIEAINVKKRTKDLFEAVLLGYHNVSDDMAKFIGKLIPDDDVADNFFRNRLTVPDDLPQRAKDNAWKTLKNIDGAKEEMAKLHSAMNSGDIEAIRAALYSPGEGASAGPFLYTHSRKAKWLYKGHGIGTKNMTKEEIASIDPRRAPYEVVTRMFAISQSIHNWMKGDKTFADDVEKFVKSIDDLPTEEKWAALADNPYEKLLAEEGLSDEIGMDSISSPYEVAEEAMAMTPRVWAPEDPAYEAELYRMANMAYNALADYVDVMSGVFERQTNRRVAPAGGLTQDPKFSAAQTRHARRAVSAKKKAEAKAEKTETKATGEAKKVAETRKDKRKRNAPATAKEEGRRKTEGAKDAAPQQLDKNDLMLEFVNEGAGTKLGESLAHEIVRRLRAKPTFPKVERKQNLMEMGSGELRARLHRAIVAGDSKKGEVVDLANELGLRLDNEGRKGILDMMDKRMERAVQREVLEAEGIPEDIGILPNSPEVLKDMQRHIIHRDPVIMETARTIMGRLYRMMNPAVREALEGETAVFDVDQLYRLMGRERPANHPAGIAISETPVFKDLRGKLMRIAVGLEKGATSPWTIMHEVGHLATEAILPPEQVDRIVSAFRATLDSDQTKAHILSNYAEKTEREQAKEWFSDKFAQHLAGRLTKNDAFDLVINGAEATQLRGFLSRTFDTIREAVAYLLNRLIGRDDMRDIFRQLTWYGDLGHRLSVPKELSPTLSPLDARSAVSRYLSDLRRKNPERYEAIMGFSDVFDANGHPVVFYHGTVAKRLLDKDAILDASQRGAGWNGPGIYVTSHPLAAIAYSETPTFSAIGRIAREAGFDSETGSFDPRIADEAKSAIVNLLEVQEVIARMKHRMEMFGGLDDGDKKFLDELREMEGALIQEVDKYGYKSHVLPLVVRAGRTFDFRESRVYDFSEDRELGLLFDRLEAEGVNIDELTEALSARAGGKTKIDGGALHEEITAEIARSRQLGDPTERTAGVEAASILTDILTDLQYDSLRIDDYGNTRRSSGVINYDTLVLFTENTNVKHLYEASEFNALKPQLRAAVRPIKPAMDLVAGAAAVEDAKTLKDIFPDGLSHLAENGARPEDISVIYSAATGRLTPEAIEGAKKRSWRYVLSTNTNRMRSQSKAFWIADFISKDEGAGYFEQQHSALGKAVMPILEKMKTLPDAGSPVKNWLRKSADLGAWVPGLGGKLHEASVPPSWRRIANALIRSDLSRLKPAELEVAEVVRQALDKAHKRMDDVGIMVGKIKNYFPQMWSVDKLRANQDKFLGALTNYYQRDSKRQGSNITYQEAREQAKKSLLRLLDEDGMVIGHRGHGSRAPMMDAEFTRLIRLDRDPEAMEDLADFLVTDLGSLLVKYFDGVERRILFNERFGVNNHGFYDWHAVSVGGLSEAINLLTTNKVVRVRRGSTTEMKEIPLLRAMRPDEAQTAIREAWDIITKGGGAEEAQAALESWHPEPNATYSKRVEAIANAMAEYYQRGRLLDGKEADFVEAAFRTIQNKRVETGYSADWMYSVSRGLRGVNSVTLLSTTAFASLSDVVLPAIRSGKLWPAMKGLAKWATDKEDRQAIRNVGVSIENLVHDRMAMLYGFGQGRFTNAFFNTSLLTPWTVMGREVAGIAAFEIIKSNIEKARRTYQAGRGIQSASHRTAARFLRRYGLESYITNKKDLGSLSDLRSDDILRFGVLRFTNETIFSPNQNDIPIWAQTPWGAVIFQLKSFPLMMSRLVGHTLREAFGSEVVDGKKVRNLNFAPLVLLLTLGGGAAIGTQAILDLVRARGEDETRDFRERKLTRILAGLGFNTNIDGTINVMGEDVPVDDFLGWYAEGFLYLGGLGLLGDLFYNVADSLDNGTFGEQRIASTLLGPSVGLMFSGIKTVAGAYDAVTGSNPSNAPERAALREVVGRVPFLGQMRDLREGIVEDIAGPGGPSSGGRSSSSAFGSGLGGGYGSGYGKS